MTGSKSPKSLKKTLAKSTRKRRKSFPQVKTFFYHAFGDKKKDYFDKDINNWLYEHRKEIKEIQNLTYDINEGVVLVIIWYDLWDE